MKKVLITFVGRAGVKKDGDKYKLGDKAEYINKTSYSLIGGNYYNTLDLFLNQESLEGYKIVPIFTEESKKAQEVILEKNKKDVVFDERFLIKDINNIKEIFKLINFAIEEYDEVIFDVTHGFRSLPILAIINMIIENIVEKNKIKHIFFGQEIVYKKKYELIDLIEYLHISNLAIALSSFLNTLKVPVFDLEDELYKELQKLSTYLLSNQFKELLIQIEKLEKIIEKSKDEKFYISNLLKEVNRLLQDIKKVVKSEDYYNQFLFFADLFLNKEYFLNAATYMIEGFNYFVTKLVQELGLIEKTKNPNEYNLQNEVVTTFLRLQKNKNFKYPHDYFLDINYRHILFFKNIRDELADIRHNLAHINLDKEYKDLEEKLQNMLKKLRKLNINKEIKKFDFSTKLKEKTITYQLELLEKQIPTYNNNKIGLKKLMDKFSKKELYKENPIEYRKKLINFCIKNQKKYEKLQSLKKEGIYILP